MTAPDPTIPIDHEVLERLREWSDALNPRSTSHPEDHPTIMLLRQRSADLRAILTDHDRLTKAYKWFSESSQVRKDGASGS